MMTPACLARGTAGVECVDCCGRIEAAYVGELEGGLRQGPNLMPMPRWGVLSIELCEHRALRLLIAVYPHGQLIEHIVCDRLCKSIHERLL